MSEKSGAGKGDKPRPVDKKKYDKNWERIFRREVDKPPRKG